ncbi:hypothetical protein CSOJ01_12819 [Colletotrichum sojae]|uniref:Uncharacterized protein n=1 Tax=Colletotrichum sojae TaxID=2175907 RepID=A0A8H6IUS3_9PEZI|nr:hypothetical protein CSOJ01_12819 [Colletotrichum sojae]
MTTTTKSQVTGSGVTEHSPAAEKGFNDGLTIGLESLLRVLKGTAVATKAPDHLAQSLTLWLQTYELGQDMTQTNDALNFSQWRGAMTASPEINKEGLRQLAQVTLAVALLRERVRRDLDVGTKSIDTIWGLRHPERAGLPGRPAVQPKVCIHAHQPFGQSWILLGSGTDCTFDVDKTEDPALATHAASRPPS